MVLLHIETTTNVCSVAISNDNDCLFEAVNADGMNHASLLSTYIQQALNTVRIAKPDAVVVSGGPGSYTGLRVGVSTAKGLCFGWGVPLIAVDTLLVMATELQNSISANALLCPMIDARRMEVYTALYNADLKEIMSNVAMVIDEHSFSDTLAKHKVVFFGNGAKKCQSIIEHVNAHFVADIVPMARNMINAGVDAYVNQNFVDLAYYEPNYVKEFYTTAKTLF